MWQFLKKGEDDMQNIDLVSDATTQTSIPGNDPNPTFSTAHLNAAEMQQVGDGKEANKEEAEEGIGKNSDDDRDKSHEEDRIGDCMQPQPAGAADSVPDNSVAVQDTGEDMLSIEKSNGAREASLAEGFSYKSFGNVDEEGPNMEGDGEMHPNVEGDGEIHSNVEGDGDRVPNTGSNGDTDQESSDDDEESFYLLIDSDDIMLKLFSSNSKLKAKTAEFFVKEAHVDKFLDILVNSYEAFMRRFETKNASYYGRDYLTSEDLADSQYVYEEFDELDYYYDHIMAKRENDDYNEADYSLEHIRKTVSENRGVDGSMASCFSGLNIAQSSGAEFSGAEFSGAEFSKEDEKSIRRSTIIADVYASDIAVITDTFIGNSDYLLRLWRILDRPGLHKVVPLVQLFVKINETLLIKKTDQYLNFVRANINLVDYFVKRNIGISLLNEFLIKLIITDKVNKPTGTIDLLMEQNFVQHLLNLIDGKYPFYIREFAGDLLKNLISLSTYTSATENDDSLIIGPNNLTREIVSHKSVWKMANKIRQGGKTLFILVDIIIELIRKNNDDYDKFSLLIFKPYSRQLTGMLPDVLPGVLPGVLPDVLPETPPEHTADCSPETPPEGASDDDVFYSLINAFPPSDHDPIYLNNILKVFSHTLPWICQALQLHFGAFEDAAIFDESNVDLYFFQEQPAATESGGKDYCRQTFGFIEKLSFDKLKLVELVAELLHCSNIKLYNNRNAEWLINTRNSLIKSKTKFLKQALADKLSLTDRKSIPECSLPVPATNESFVADNDDDSFEKFQYENGSDSDFHIGPGVAELSEEERKAKKESMLSKLALKIDNNINTKVPSQAEQAEPVSENWEAESHMYNRLCKGDEDSESLGFSCNVPFVCEANEAKLREKCSLGDMFKTALHDSGILELIIKKMFLKYPWNNFWHNVVFDLVQQLLNGLLNSNYNAFLVSDLFRRSRLTDLILVAHKKNTTFKRMYNIEFGYMGHVSLISEEINKFSVENNLDLVDPQIGKLLAHQSWLDYVNGTLAETRKNYSLVLGGKRPEDDKYYRNPDAILLGSTEKEIENQDPAKSNPSKFKKPSDDDDAEDDDDDDDDDDVRGALLHPDDEDGDDQDDDSDDDAIEESFPVKFEQKQNHTKYHKNFHKTTQQSSSDNKNNEPDLDEETDFELAVRNK